MSDLTERFPNSPELYAPAPAPERAPAQQSNEQKFLEEHPEIGRMRKEPATSDRRKEILESVKGLRIGYFRDQAASRELDLTTEEIYFASRLLALRIEGNGSLRGLLDGIEGDLASDYDRLAGDIRELRRQNSKIAALGKRYPTMPSDPVTRAKQYLYPSSGPSTEPPEKKN
jgi:hypothetical protein